MRIIIITSIIVAVLAGWAIGDEIDDLIPAIIEIESGGNPHAVSPAGAVGLMQLSVLVVEEYAEIEDRFYLDAAPGFVVQRWYDKRYIPSWNLMVGEWYLRRIRDHYLKENYTVERLLHAWNGGITKLRKYNYDCSKMPKESREFSRKVLKYMGEK